jgi:hypothetical protein
MSTQSINLSKSGCLECLSDASFAYLLPQVRCVTELQAMASDLASAGYWYVFKVYSSYHPVIECCFNSEQDAEKARRTLIAKMSLYWGPDQIIYTNGFDNDVTVVAAIRELGEVFQKDGNAEFGITVADVPYRLHLVFSQIGAASQYHQTLCAKLEQHRRRQSLMRHKSAVAIA